MTVFNEATVVVRRHPDLTLESREAIVHHRVFQEEVVGNMQFPPPEVEIIDLTSFAESGPGGHTSEFMTTTIMGIVQGTRQPLLLPQPQPPHLEEVKEQNQAPFLRINYLFKEFLKLKPPMLPGARMQSKPMLGWLQKVRLAAYQLEGEARRLVDYKGKGRTGYGLETFSARILGEIHASIIVGCQGLRISKSVPKWPASIAEHQVNFIKLEEYAPHLVATENQKARKFEDRLKAEIKRVVRPLRLQTYAEGLDRALVVEQDLNESKRFWENRRRKNVVEKSTGGTPNKQPSQRHRWETPELPHQPVQHAENFIQVFSRKQ
ncbi:hypothetical protein Acr_10g0003760 [Actinidia rufa]|uniref:Uncharacterized protein n=1 Tax=Actinidia rufa TaxID=165716 RepID=A0A7J0F8L9_9ERIC|nr:hypothetical protein Acr_10g0003760 [Actinidia rufa]